MMQTAYNLLYNNVTSTALKESNFGQYVH